jgi:phenylalanyl-tRNA synthetase alpha chain
VSLIEDIALLVAEGSARFDSSADLAELKAAELEVIGKRGSLARLNNQLGGLEPDERRRIGRLINEGRETLNDRLAGRRRVLEADDRRRRLAAERLDLTEAVARAGSGGAWAGSAGEAWGAIPRGHMHVVTQTRTELEDVFVALGFQVAEGPEAETDWYNFEALNLPPDHPARGLWDTLYLRLGEPETVLLRTHTSPVQIHLMESQPPPIYAVMPGRCYRRDTPDARHLPVFHQIEGLVVDRGITFGDLAGTIQAFTGALFGPDVKSRLRPSYFPFTEPSAEFDVTCPICGGTGCRTCTGSGWIELGGCGMVDPNVFAAVGIDSEVYSGFAFGFGIDRLAQVVHTIDDMRVLLDSDLRFLSQF